MEQVIMKTSHTETGYCCTCDLLPGWTVSGSKDFKRFKVYVQESIDFYLDCAKKDGDKYPAVFDGKYEIIYLFDTCALLNYYQGILSFPVCNPLPVFTKSSWLIMQQDVVNHARNK